MITVCRAGVLHLPQMAEILNEIIAAGGTTAITGEIPAEELGRWMAAERSAWHVAEDAGGQVLGFQWIAPGGDYLPPEAAEIATFARIGRTGLGIGSKLFEHSVQAARNLGYGWINANIRADNTGGLIYYQSRGFEDYGRINGHQMADGTVVDKVLKRYDLG